MKKSLIEYAIILGVQVVRLLSCVLVVAVGCAMGWLVGNTFGPYLSRGIEQAFGVYIPPATYPALAGFLSFFNVTQLTVSFHSPRDD